MNEQDKEAFEKWYDSSLGTHVETWQAALEYERRDSSIKIAQAQAVAIQERERSKKLAEADAKIDELKQQVIDYETDWLKMRKYYDGAMVKMAIAIEALEKADKTLSLTYYSFQPVRQDINEALEKIKR